MIAVLATCCFPILSLCVRACAPVSVCVRACVRACVCCVCVCVCVCVCARAQKYSVSRNIYEQKIFSDIINIERISPDREERYHS